MVTLSHGKQTLENSWPSSPVKHEGVCTSVGGIANSVTGAAVPIFDSKGAIRRYRSFRAELTNATTGPGKTEHPLERGAIVT